MASGSGVQRFGREGDAALNDNLGNTALKALLRPIEIVILQKGIKVLLGP